MLGSDVRFEGKAQSSNAEPARHGCSSSSTPLVGFCCRGQSMAGSSHYRKLTAVTLRGVLHSLDCARDSGVPILCAEGAIIMTLSRLRLSVADARDLAEGALRGIGYHNDEARIIADHVIDAAMCGYEYSGLAKILNVFESEQFRLPRRSMKVLRETEVSLAFDGGNNVGMLALFHAAQATINKAAAHGIALVSVTDAWMSGRGAYYVEMIAKHGLVAIHTASSSPLVAPPGGIRPVLGTNPIAIAVPSSRGPIVLDMGTSAYMMTEVMLRERLGELLPEGVALGPTGEPTRDPTAARLGALLPFGGYKGFALALMMQALGLLAGSGLDAESDYGYLFITFRP